MSKKHYKLSPSSSKRWMKCPGSLKLSQGIPNKDSIYSLEGTRAHDVAERASVSGKRAEEVTDDKEMAEAVQVFLDELERVRSSVQLIVEHSERKLECNYLDGLGGTSDHMMAYIEGGKVVLHIFDYKHGAGVAVDVVENEQILSYLLITESHYQGMFDEFRATVVQPRCFEGRPVQTWSCSLERLRKHLDDIKESQTQDHLAAGSWCQFCKAITICPKVREATAEAAQNEFSIIKDDAEELLRFKELEPAIKAFLNSIDTAMLDKYRDGSGGVPGHKVVERHSHRHWVSADPKRVAMQLEGLGLSRSHYIEEKFRTPAQVEKELRDKEAKKKFKDIAKTNVIGWKVVPVTAKGKAVDFNDVSEFSEITE